jgi:hypothetical protein
MEYWNDEKDKKTKISLNPLFQDAVVSLFQMRSEAGLSHFCGLSIALLSDRGRSSCKQKSFLEIVC